MRQALYGAGRPPRKSGHVRQQGRHYDPPDEPQRRQGAIRDRPRHCHAGRSAPGRRRIPRPVGSRRADAGNGAQHGRRSGRVRAGESQSRNLVRQRDGCPRGHHFRNGPFRLSEPGQQRARIPLYLPGGFGRAGDEDQRGDENRRRARARQAGQRTRSRHRGRRIQRQRHHFRSRVPDSQGARSEADLLYLGRRRESGHRVGSRPQGDHRLESLHGRAREPHGPGRQADAGHPLESGDGRAAPHRLQRGRASVDDQGRRTFGQREHRHAAACGQPVQDQRAAPRESSDARSPLHRRFPERRAGGAP